MELSAPKRKAWLWEALAAAVVIAILGGVPAAFFAYEHALAVAAGKGPRTRVVTLTGVDPPGVWTTGAIAGYNYWWQKPQPTDEIKAGVGDTVVFRVKSGDVIHGFSIPALGIDAVEVEPGHLEMVRVEADRAGSFPFLCTTVCGDGHEDMSGVLTVEEPLGEPDVEVAVTVSEEFGFQPAVIRVHQGDVVRVKVTSESDGMGDGVGFAISGYESKVDLQGIRKGRSRTFNFKADTPGTFLIYSSTQAGPEIDTALADFIVEQG